MVVDGVLLVARGEVEDLALAAPPAAAGAEHLAAGEGGDEDQLVGGRDVEELPVHLLLVDEDGLRYAAGDRVGRGHGPDQLDLGVVAPGQRAGGAHQPLEDLGEVPGVQHQQAHPAEHPLVHPLDHRVVHLGVGGVAPPGEDVGGVQTSSVSPCSGSSWVAVRTSTALPRSSRNSVGDGAVHPLGIALGHAGPIAVGVFVEVLAPDGDAEW